MDDLRTRDTKLFTRELLRGPRLLGFICVGLFLLWSVAMAAQSGGISLAWFLILGVPTLGFSFRNAYKDSIKRRFYDRRFAELWATCQDRVSRNTAALKSLRHGSIADMRELPVTVERLANDLYGALRRADLVLNEAMESEKEIRHPRASTLPAFPDKHAQELLQVADRNIAEYNAHMSKVLSGVQRTEAQAVVFITTLDTLRARMLSHTTGARTATLDNAEFLIVIKETRQQLDAIDKALDEIDEPTFRFDSAQSDLRETLSKTPPPIPDSVVHRMQQTSRSSEKENE